MKKLISLLFLLSGLVFTAPDVSAACIKHTFVSAKADSADATLIRPSNWNACHTIEAGTIVAADLSFDPATQVELDAHINDTSAAHAASAISADSATLVGTGTNVQAVFEELDNAIVAAEAATAAHLADSTAAHAASAISVSSTTLVGTGIDAQAVFEELDDAIANHLADSSAAHAASAVLVNSANLAGTGVDAQTVLEELEDAIDTKVGGTGIASKIPRWTNTTTLGDSSCSDDGAGTISCGDISGNHYVETNSAATGTHTHNNIAQSGDRVLSTGARTTDNCVKWNSNGVAISSGGACGSGGGSVEKFYDFGSNMSCSAGGGDTKYVGMNQLLSSTEFNASYPYPRAGTAGAMYVKLPEGGTMPAGQTLVLTLRVAGADTGISCTLGPTDSNCNDIGATAAITAGQAVSLKLNCSGGTTAIPGFFANVSVQ